MDIRKLLSEVTSIQGVSGQEANVAEYLAEQFRPLVDEVTVTRCTTSSPAKRAPAPMPRR